MWSVILGYLSESRGLADTASTHFRIAVIAALGYCGEDQVAGMRERHCDIAFRWGKKNLETIKSCRPADHVDVKDTEQLWVIVLQLSALIM